MNQPSCKPPRRVAPLWFAVGLAAATLPAAARAQDDDIDEIAEPVVQPVPGAASQKLNSALALLARNPRDVEALIAAGQAALGMGDVDAAVGFYQRADALSPGSARIKAGLAGALVRSEDPFAAIPLFDEAEKAGPIDPALLGERGLAYDLVGDNVTAQVFYKQALQAQRDDETIRRLALSQAIAGDRRGMELTLSPLLQKQDKAAWRARAFALAILGSSEEAESIARSSMPADMANGLAGYLRYMPRLTAAQQAAAANLGHFPRAADIGRDDPRLALYQRPRAVVARAEQSLTPTGAPLGGDGRKQSRSKRMPAPAPAPIKAAAVPPPQIARVEPVALPQPAKVQPTPAGAAPAVKPPVAAPVSVAAAATAKPDPATVPPKPVQIASADPRPVPAPAANKVFGPPAQIDPQPQPVRAEPQPAPASPPQPVAAPAPKPAPPPAPKPRNLADVFADFEAPSREVVTQSGAVDVRKLAATKAAADAKAEKDAKEAEAKKAKPSHPSRIWVQVATGRNKDALAFDWRRMNREKADLFKARKPFTSAWGQTNRLLTGPFESEKAADAYIAQLRKGGLPGAFSWTSPAGQVVDALAVGK